MACQHVTFGGVLLALSFAVVAGFWPMFMPPRRSYGRPGDQCGASPQPSYGFPFPQAGPQSSMMQAMMLEQMDMAEFIPFLPSFQMPPPRMRRPPTRRPPAYSNYGPGMRGRGPMAPRRGPQPGPLGRFPPIGSPLEAPPRPGMPPPPPGMPLPPGMPPPPPPPPSNPRPSSSIFAFPPEPQPRSPPGPTDIFVPGPATDIFAPPPGASVAFPDPRGQPLRPPRPPPVGYYRISAPSVFPNPPPIRSSGGYGPVASVSIETIPFDPLNASPISTGPIPLKPPERQPHMGPPPPFPPPPVHSRGFPRPGSFYPPDASSRMSGRPEMRPRPNGPDMPLPRRPGFGPPRPPGFGPPRPPGFGSPRPPGFGPPRPPRFGLAGGFPGGSPGMSPFSQFSPYMAMMLEQLDIPDIMMPFYLQSMIQPPRSQCFCTSASHCQRGAGRPAIGSYGECDGRFSLVCCCPIMY